MSVEFSHEGHLIKVCIQSGVQIGGTTGLGSLRRFFNHLRPRTVALTY
jgi:hypothetical protein